jgi:hypothetical protein
MRCDLHIRLIKVGRRKNDDPRPGGDGSGNIGLTGGSRLWPLTSANTSSAVVGCRALLRVLVLLCCLGPP